MHRRNPPRPPLSCYSNTLHALQVQGATLGIIGYGDIGQAAAIKAKAMGMKIVAQRRRPELSSGDGIADEVLGAGQVSKILPSSSDL